MTTPVVVVSSDSSSSATAAGGPTTFVAWTNIWGPDPRPRGCRAGILAAMTDQFPHQGLPDVDQLLAAVTPAVPETHWYDWSQLEPQIITWAPIIFMALIVLFIWRTLKLMPKTKPQQIKPASSD